MLEIFKIERIILKRDETKKKQKIASVAKRGKSGTAKLAEKNYFDCQQINMRTLWANHRVKLAQTSQQKSDLISITTYKQHMLIDQTGSSQRVSNKTALVPGHNIQHVLLFLHIFFPNNLHWCKLSYVTFQQEKKASF